MRSKAAFMGDPIHPMLIPFPIAFLSGAFAANLIGRVVLGSEPWWTVGAACVVAGACQPQAAAANRSVMPGLGRCAGAR